MHRPVDQESIDQMNAEIREELARFAGMMRKSVIAAQPAIEEFKRSMVNAANALRESLRVFGEALQAALDDSDREKQESFCACPVNAPSWPDESRHLQKEDCLCEGCGNPLNEGAHGGNICT